MSNFLSHRRAASRLNAAAALAFLCLAACGQVWAQDAERAPMPASAWMLAAPSPVADHERIGVLAFNTQEAGAVSAAAPGTSPPPFKPPFFSGSDAHKYLGLGTLAAVVLTAAAAPGEGCEHNCAAGVKRQTSGTTHTRMARTAAVLAGATVGSGLLVHWNDFHLSDGLSDPDNQHVLLGLAGSMLMLYAVNKSLHSSVPTQHGGIAELGGAAMAVAVKLTW